MNEITITLTEQGLKEIVLQLSKRYYDVMQETLKFNSITSEYSSAVNYKNKLRELKLRLDRQLPEESQYGKSLASTPYRGLYE